MFKSLTGFKGCIKLLKLFEHLEPLNLANRITKRTSVRRNKSLIVAIQLVTQ